MSVGSNGAVIEANREASKMLGYPPDGLIGRKVFDFYPDTPDGIEKALEVFERFKRGEDIRNVTLQHVRKDGQLIWGSLTVIGRRGPVTSGIWAGIAVGIVALGLRCFANLNTFEI